MKKREFLKKAAFPPVIIMFIMISLNLFAVSDYTTAADDFKKTGFYTEKHFFDGAFILSAGSLKLIASKEFMNLEQYKKNAVCKEAVNTWKRVAGIAGRAVFVEISEGGRRSTLWKSQGEDSAVMLEQWGPGITFDSGRSIFMSAALTANSAQENPIISATFGTYFFKDILDSALNIYVAGTSAQLGLSARAHYLINSKWDLNGGFSLSLTSSDKKDPGVFDLAMIIGASNFISYRSSLDFSLSAGTSGVVTIGSGVTYYFDKIPLIGPQEKPAGGKNEKDSVQNITAVKNTATPENTTAATDTPWPTATNTPQPIVTETPQFAATDTPQPTATDIPQPKPADKIQSETISAPLAKSTPSAEPTMPAVYAKVTEENTLTIPTPRAEEVKAAEFTATRTAALPHEEDKVNDSAPQSVQTQQEAKPTQREAVETPGAPITEDAKASENSREDSLAGSFIEGDILNASMSISKNWNDFEMKLGYGDDGIFGISIMPQYMSNKKGSPEYYAAGLDIAFDLYPLGRSPSGIYIGPLIGARYYTNDIKNIDPNGVKLTYGGEAGARLLASWFVLDAGVTYNITEAPIGWPDGMIRDLKVHAQAGLMFYGVKNSRNKNSTGEGSGEENDSTAGFYIEGDVLNFVKNYENNIYDIALRFGPGRDSFYATSFILEGSYYKNSISKGYLAGADIAFDFYPFSSSPSGLYLGPVIGGKYKVDQTGDTYSGDPVFSAGGEAGLRVLIGWLVLDGSFDYSYYMYHYQDKPYEIKKDYMFRAGAGLMFYSSGDKNQ
jgi:hypothetical protein